MYFSFFGCRFRLKNNFPNTRQTLTSTAVVVGIKRHQRVRLNVVRASEEFRIGAEPLARFAFGQDDEEIAAAILYLCSEEARVVNGARIPLYGGG